MSRFRRAALALAALGVAAWLAGSLRSLERLDDAPAAVATARAESGGEAAVRRARAELKAARRFGPDVRALLKEGQLLALLGQRDEAIRLFSAAARREPENFEAWALLYRLTEGRDAERARRRATALDPTARIGPR